MVNDKIVDVGLIDVKWESTVVVTIDFSKIPQSDRASYQTDVEDYMKTKFPNNAILVIGKNDSIYAHTA